MYKPKNYTGPITIVKGKHDDLHNFIISLLREYPKLSMKNIEKLLTNDAMEQFKKAFTTPDADPNNNYEFYELLGDSTANNCIVWYFQRRFFKNVETITSSKGTMSPLAIMGRLKQEGASVRQFSKFSNQLGFLPYITMTNLEYEKPTKILEDVFESFIGCLVYHVEKTFGLYTGITIAYPFIEKLFDKEDFSITKEKLYDAKSILNEDKTKFKNFGINIDYNTRENPDKSDILSRYMTFITIKSTGNLILSTGEYFGKDKQSIELQAAKELLSMNNYKLLKQQFKID